MKFHVDTAPQGGYEVGKTYNHGPAVCRNGHDECAERAGGKCLDDVVFLCRRCRCELIGSEIEAGICGEDALSRDARIEIVRGLRR